MTVFTRASRALAPYALNGILPFQARVEMFDAILGEWVAEASGSSVSWLASAADEAADFGRIRIVSQFGTVLAD